jgi:hypothetical protein
VLAHRQRHRPARAVDLVGDLRAGGRGADDEHATCLELIRVAVFSGRKRGDRGGQRLGDRRDLWDIARSACEHDGAALPVALVGGDFVAIIAATHRSHLGVCMNGSRDYIGIALDEGDGFGHRAVPVGVVTLVTVTRQSTLPVWREQSQRVPALGPPRIRHLAALEDHMVDRVLAEAAAHGQTGVAGSDDDRRGTHPILRVIATQCLS